MKISCFVTRQLSALGYEGFTTTEHYTDGMIRSFRGRVPAIPESAYVDASAQILGDVALGEHASVWLNAVLRGDVHEIRVGAGSNIQDGAVLHGMRDRFGVYIGTGCTIGHNATVHGCVLEDDVLIGMGAVLLNGAHVGQESIVAAGTVITEGMQVPPRSLVAGVPGKVRRTTTAADVALIRSYAANYLQYTGWYLEAFGTK